MNRMMVAAACAVCASSPALAADWVTDPGRSHLTFAGTQLGSGFTGTFDRFAAVIAFDPAAPASGHVTVTVDLASAHTGDTQRDTALPEGDWFDVGKTPQAKFAADKFVAKGGNAFEAPGALTLRGATHPLTLTFTLDISGSTAHAMGHAQITRSDWGVGQGQFASGDMVGLGVDVAFDIFANRK